MKTFVSPVWLSTRNTLPPHGIARVDQVADLTESFRRFGWDSHEPRLVGYMLPDRHSFKVQLLSGSHRWAAACRAGIRIPVVIVPYDWIEKAWGDLESWKEIMRAGDVDSRLAA